MEKKFLLLIFMMSRQFLKKGEGEKIGDWTYEKFLETGDANFNWVFS